MLNVLKMTAAGFLIATLFLHAAVYGQETSASDVITSPADATVPIATPAEAQATTAPALQASEEESAITAPVEPGSAEAATTAPVTPAVKPISAEPPAETAAPDSSTTGTATLDSASSVTLEGGVSYQVVKQGTGPEASTTGTMLIHYTLYLKDGKKVESSRETMFPVPFSFTPGSGEAIRGMEIGITDMKVGEVRKLFIPADMAYGSTGQGTNIPPNSDLVFELELVDVKTTASTATEQ